MTASDGQWRVTRRKWQQPIKNCCHLLLLSVTRTSSEAYSSSVSAIAPSAGSAAFSRNARRKTNMPLHRRSPFFRDFTARRWTRLSPRFFGDSGLTPCIPTALTLRYSGRQSRPYFYSETGRTDWPIYRLLPYPSMLLELKLMSYA